jgi:hypothetical protein
MSLHIRKTTASVWLRGKWRVSVRAKGCESIEKMVIRLAIKAHLQESFSMPPPPKPKPGRRSKAALRQVRSHTLTVN